MVLAVQDLLYKSVRAVVPSWQSAGVPGPWLTATVSAAHISFYIELCYGEQFMQFQAGGTPKRVVAILSVPLSTAVPHVTPLTRESQANGSQKC